jgi:hypothetical protein
MDNESHVPEVRRGDGTPSPVRTLRRIDPKNDNPDRLLWLWNQIRSQEYAFDDTTKDNHHIFLEQLFMPNTEAYEFGDAGFLFITGIMPPVSALIHFVAWEDIEPREILEVKRVMLNHLFTDYGLMRVTAVIPAFNKQAIRMATITGFRYEGEMRKAFLNQGVYHNLHIYGLLKSEFYTREVKH